MTKLAIFPVLVWIGTLALRLPAAQVLEIDLGLTEPTATASPTAAPSPTAEPRGEPSPAASPAAEAPPSPTPAPRAALDEVRFDAAEAEAGAEGLMIIAPGAASPEDSLESFGIDSPYNWKSRTQAPLKPGERAEEALELAAPETGSLDERVRVETGTGERLPGEADYEAVERAGLVLAAEEYRSDGRLVRMVDGSLLGVRGRSVALRMEAGRQIYPGSVYTVFREGGLMRSGGEAPREVGMLVVNVGVVRVVRIEGEEVLARVERQYQPLREGDQVRLRDPERLRYYSAVRQGGQAPAELQGEVIGFQPPKLVGRRGDLIYLDVGRRQGAWPGLRLQLLREPARPRADGRSTARMQKTGRLGLVEIVNVSRESSVARVVQAAGVVRPGDKVRFR